MIDAHEEKETLHVEVDIPEHADRTETPLFERTRKALLARDRVCWVCGRTGEEAGAPLEVHHLGIERCFAEAPIDWEIVKRDFPDFDWASFDPSNPYTFVDDMLAQGRLLCKEHHTAADSGIHCIPDPLFKMQRYLKAGYRYSPTEKIIHEAP